MVLNIGPINDVVPALREAGRKGSICSLVNENIRHALRSTVPKKFGRRDHRE
jgi:hypothetical protein